MTLKSAIRTILKEIRDPGCPARYKCVASFCVAYNPVRNYLKRA